MPKEQFEKILDEFADVMGTDLYLDEENSTVFTVDDSVLINLKYLEASDTVVLFSPVGAFGSLNAPDAGQKALALLKLSDIGTKTTGQVTLMLDNDAELVLAADRRSAQTLLSRDELASWVDHLVNAVDATRDYFYKHFPAKEG